MPLLSPAVGDDAPQRPGTTTPNLATSAGRLGFSSRIVLQQMARAAASHAASCSTQPLGSRLVHAGELLP